MIVLDASAAVELLGNTDAGRRVRDALAAEEVVHAPHLLDLEVANVLRRQCALQSLSPQAAADALLLIQRLPIVRHGHGLLLGRIWDLRHNFTAYDACYLALAEALGATLLTRDESLLAAPLRRGSVELL